MSRFYDKAVWHKARRVLAVENGVLLERFRDHDLRAKTASDTDLKHTASLLAHNDEKTTQKYYRRKAEIVRPLQ
jgi:integrase